MTIAEVSKKYNLTADTIRYYEKIGLIPTVPRTEKGIRNFDEESCNWIEFIKCMRNAGMEIEILLEYVNLLFCIGGIVFLLSRNNEEKQVISSV